MRDKPVVYLPVEVDTEAKTVTLTRPTGPPGSDKPPVQYVVRYTEPEPDVTELTGEMELYANGTYGKKQVRARLRHVPGEKFLLYSRGCPTTSTGPGTSRRRRSCPRPSGRTDGRSGRAAARAL